MLKCDITKIRSTCTIRLSLLYLCQHLEKQTPRLAYWIQKEMSGVKYSSQNQTKAIDLQSALQMLK